MTNYPNKPGDGHLPERKLDPCGFYEVHSCIKDCELPIYVCALCGGDYHEDHPDRSKCPLNK